MTFDTALHFFRHVFWMVAERGQGDVSHVE